MTGVPICLSVARQVCFQLLYKATQHMTETSMSVCIWNYWLPLGVDDVICLHDEFMLAMPRPPWWFPYSLFVDIVVHPISVRA